MTIKKFSFCTFGKKKKKYKMEILLQNSQHIALQNVAKLPFTSCK